MADNGGGVKHTRRSGQDLVIALSGAIDLHHAPHVHQALISACEQRPRRLIIDLTDVAYMDSSGIGTLVEVFRRVNAYQGSLALFGLNQRVRSVFEITRLERFFKIFPSESEALAE
jgi:anti-sigma B factor antagonist